MKLQFAAVLLVLCLPVFGFARGGTSNAGSGSKVCLIMAFKQDLKGTEADLKNYREIASNNDCQKIEVNEKFFIDNAPKEKALAKLKDMIGNKDILMMYSGHGVCMPNSRYVGQATSLPEDYQPKSGARTRGFARVLTVGKENSMFGMYFADPQPCIKACAKGKGYKDCEISCIRRVTVNDEDFAHANFFSAKNVTTITDACASGCRDLKAWGAKSHVGLTSAASNQESSDSPQGGALNLKLKELASSQDGCIADTDKDGMISMTEAVEYYSKRMLSTDMSEYMSAQAPASAKVYAFGNPRSKYAPLESVNLLKVADPTSCKNSGASGGNEAKQGGVR